MIIYERNDYISTKRFQDFIFFHKYSKAYTE